MNLLLRMIILLLLQCAILVGNESCWYQRVELGAEWLYWEAWQSQMDIGSEVTGSGNVALNAKNIKPNFEYSNGYRLFAQYALNPCWNLGAQVTHFQSHPTNEISLDPAQLTSNFISFNEKLYFIFSSPSITGTSVSSLDINWDLDCYYFDLDLSRKFYLGCCIEFEPYVGIKGLWMQQKYLADGASPADPGGAFTMNLGQIEKVYGIGLESGIHGNYALGCGFSLIGEFGASLMYSKVKTRITLETAQAGVNQINSIKDTNYKSLPTLDSFIGATYALCLRCALINLYVGWENHLFFHTNQFTIPANGNLTTQGLTLGGNVQF